MTANQFRRLALSLPEAEESAHMGHPDFRVCGKIFATLGPAGADWGMVKLTPEEQRQLIHDEPDVFVPCKGSWGKRGCTQVVLVAATASVVRPALLAAWRHVAPQRLVGSDATEDGQ